MTTSRIVRVPRTRTILTTLVILGAVATGCSSSDTGTEGTTGGGGAPETTVGAPPASGELLASVCAGTAGVTDGGTVSSTSVTEASGIAASRANPGVWWINNDSGDSARVFAVSATGTLLATVEVGGADGGRLGGHRGRSASTSTSATSATTAGPVRASPSTGSPSRSSIRRRPASTDRVEADALPSPTPTGRTTPRPCSSTPWTGDLVIVTKDWTLAAAPRSSVRRPISPQGRPRCSSRSRPSTCRRPGPWSRPATSAPTARSWPCARTTPSAVPPPRRTSPRGRLHPGSVRRSPTPREAGRGPRLLGRRRGRYATISEGRTPPCT